ncbi:MAG TPA: hypothetical protein VGG28_24485 [Kofleriaceae bacterium]|jgi:hypothetical protein
MNNTISLELLAAVTGGCQTGTSPIIPEDGGIVGPIGSPTPNFGRRGKGPIPESGGIVGPLGSPTPF